MSAYTALTRATYKATVRDATTIFFTFAFPLVFLVVFGLIFKDQQIGRTGHNYIDSIAPGVLSWGLANAAVFGISFMLMQWRNDDLLRLIRLSPASIGSVVVSRYVCALVIGIAQSVLFVGVALLPPFGLRLDSRWPLALPVMVLAVTVFMTLGMIIGNRARTPEAVAAVANCVMVPMAFLSGSFYPVALMPGWLQAVSRVLPLRYVNDGMAYAIVGEGHGGHVLVSAAILVGFSVVFAVIGIRTFRWSNGS